MLLFRPRLNIPIFLPFLENILVPFLKKKEFIKMFYAVLFISFVLYLRYKCITCTFHRTVIGIEHLVIASAGFFNLLLVLPFRERNNFIRLSQETYNYPWYVLYLQIFNTQNYILFKISALDLFLKFRKDILKISQISASIFL